MSWTLIESQTLSSSQASVTLGSGGSLPQTYKTLMLVCSARTDRTTATIDDIFLEPNAATANRSDRYLYGDGSAAASSSSTSLRIGSTATNACTANTFGNSVGIIPNYSGSTNKPTSTDGVGENNATSSYQLLIAGLWSNTAAITSMRLVPGTGPNFVSGSTFTLYGLK